MPPTDFQSTPGHVFEGLATFNANDGFIYRYQITVEAATLRVCLEEIVDKKQWYIDATISKTKDLSMEEVTGVDSKIPMASLVDYAKAPLPSDDFTREITPSTTEEDALVLRLSVKLHSCGATWTPVYSFDLQQTKPELVDRLAAKIHDRDELIARLQHRVSQLEAAHLSATATAPVFAKATPVDRAEANETIVWKADESIGGPVTAVQFLPTGGIRFKTPGVFVVDLLLYHFSIHINETVIDIQLNGEPSIAVVDTDRSDFMRILSTTNVITVKAEDEIAFVYRGSDFAYEHSSVVIYRLH